MRYTIVRPKLSQEYVDRIFVQPPRTRLVRMEDAEAPTERCPDLANALASRMNQYPELRTR
jgi:hypothetical protein